MQASPLSLPHWEQLWQENRLIWWPVYVTCCRLVWSWWSGAESPGKKPWAFPCRKYACPGSDPSQWLWSRWYVRTFGKDRLLELIARAPSMVDYYIENVMGIGHFWEDRDVLRKSLSFIRHIDNAIERNLLLKSIGKTWHWPGYFKNRDFPFHDRFPKRCNKAKEASGTVDLLEMNLIHILMMHPEKLAVMAETNILNYFISPDLKSLGEEWRCSLPDRALDAVEFISRLDSGVLRKDCWERLLMRVPMMRRFWIACLRIRLSRLNEDGIGK